MPDWRDEVCAALDFWISAEGRARQAERLTCLGAARQESERGWYSVDSRSILNVDQVESLRLSGKAGPGAGQAYTVLDATQDGPVIRVRVAEFVDLADAYLWQNKQSATHLLTKLREGIANLADPGLAHDLAAGRLATAPKITRQVHGFTEMQKEAYESCLSAGVRLVWGPPGTGKTRVLAEAIDALLTAGRRVLLVSSTNIAVDNALLGVINTRSHKRGDLLRVGLPHHPDVLRHPGVCLPHLVRDQLTDVDRERQAIETRLLELRQADEELARLQEETAGFDPMLYRRTAELVAAEALIPDLAAAVAQASATALDRQRDVDRCDGEVVAAEDSARELDAARSAYAQIDCVERRLGEIAAAADELGARALTTRHAADQLADDLQAEEYGNALTRLRGRQRIRKLRNALEAASQRADDVERRARAAEDLLDRRRVTAASRVNRLTAKATASRADIDAADARLDVAQQAAAEAARAARQAEDDLGRKQQVLLAAEAGPRPTCAQRAAMEDAERRQLPALAARLESVRSQIADAQPERARLQDEYSRVQERFERLRQDAEGEIIRQACLVATTLARLRTSKALMDGPYDVVLVDEAGAATLPEILLAASRARRAAVLLGDFFQLGPVLKPVVEQASRPDVQRWIHRNVFEHCGITTISDAQQSEGCTVLDVQHRFGPQIMRLANAVAYGGVLKPGNSVRAHIDDDPEIVLIDVDGLGDLATVRSRTERSGGWWPAGALLSRVLADYHQARGERTGVVAPYSSQIEATLEALRDQEGAAIEATEIGTVHRFQGREFPVVVFDLVEDTGRRWMGQASSGGGRYRVNGLRLFTVAITRAQSRLYLIGSRTQISTAPDGTPLAQIARMLRARQARSVSATALITPTLLTGTDVPPLGPFSCELAEILAHHVHVADIHDERSFYDVFAGYLNSARNSIWIWAPWTANRVRSLLPVLADAADRGVRITLFVRDPRDTLQGRQQSQRFLADLRAVVTTVVEINVMHQKIVVIDDRTVLLGSLNTLSQSWTREVMLVMIGSHFARKILEHERATDFSSPPSCRICRSTQIDLRRRRSGEWFWQCYSPACPGLPGKPRKPWTQSIKENPKGLA